MDSAALKHPSKATPGAQPGGVAASKDPKGVPKAESKISTPAPRPIMSAKAAINAMYADKKKYADVNFVPSAREAVNAASRLAQKNVKSASSLHHGSLQKVQKVEPDPRSMESTRTSASALFKTAHSDAKDVPVVHTSLKLGANARPKAEPVILPAGARMAKEAQPVAGAEANGSAVAVQRGHMKSTARTINVDSPEVKVITSGRPKLVSAPRRVIRDPQMLSGGRRVIPAKITNAQAASGQTVAMPQRVDNGLAVSGPKRAVANAGRTARAGNISQITPTQPQAMRRTSDIVAPKRLSRPAAAGQPSRPRRFRAAPKDYVVTAASKNVAVDNSYAMSEPPKLVARRRDAAASDLGVVKNFRPTKLPEPLGDAAPIGRLAGQRVASGHGGPAESAMTIKAENTSNYSFSRREDKAPKAPSYAPADKSPFLKSVTVEKRPLSDSASAPTPISLPRATESKPEKASRKNSYQKKTADGPAIAPTRPTVIVPSSRRSKAPLFFLILFTIVLGAAVGAAVYLCFFQ